jgi:hypothetical protein
MIDSQDTLPDGVWLDRLNPSFLAARYASWAGHCSTLEAAAEAFRQHGFASLATIDDGLDFDASYYREVNPAWEGADELSCYRHWLVEGLAFGRHGSGKAHLNGLGLSLATYPEAFHWRYYARLRPHVGANRWLALDDFCETGFAVFTETFPFGSGAVDFLLALGRKFSIADDRLAVRAYELARSYGPIPPSELQHLADSYLRLSLWRPAMTIYRSLIEDGHANGWTVLNFVKAASRLLLWEDLLVVLKRAHETLAQDSLWPMVVAELLQNIFDCRVGAARVLMADGHYEQADDSLVNSVDHLFGIAEAFGSSRSRQSVGEARTILILANLDDAARAQRRVYEKARLMERVNQPCETAIYTNASTYLEALDGIAAVILYRTPAVPGIIQLIVAARARGIPIVFESDVLLLPSNAPPLKFFRGRITRSLYDDLRLGIALTCATARLCDFAIGPTKGIAEILRPMVRERRCFVVPNSLLPESLDSAAGPKKSHELKLFLHGSNLSFLDAAPGSIGMHLLAFLQRRPEVRLIVHGPIHLDPRFDQNADRISYIDQTDDPLAYWIQLSQCDINLAIKCESPEDIYETELSWAEAAACAVPSVVLLPGREIPYIRDGINAGRAARAEAWVKALESLLREPARRRQLGVQAKDDVMGLASAAIATAGLQSLVYDGVNQRYGHARSF